MSNDGEGTMTRRRRRRQRRGRGTTARIASGAVVGLGLGLMFSGVFGAEYLVYAIAAGAALGAAFAALVERRRGRGAA